ncbi:peptidylprolyl isomerase [Gordonia sp. PDNC005]|uniref:peptidylprolyl isomerase n=1 Tax=unclassified Gordonia (in: high G+C Gram-positive bacteria) TaxID=2657482 RepID=UPI001963C10C|nr:peptidylprolyl isomerase [Gordonia sp. PDNC005]QRY64006.1 peptidylprolyl isomerase [Gordonia sp. PDNC005]
MSTNEERREAARQKLEERLARERQAAKKRKLSMLAAAGVAVVAIAAVGGYFWYRNWDDKRHTTCDYTAAPVDFAKTIKAVETQLATAPAEQKAQGEAFLKELRDGEAKQRTSPTPDGRTLNTGTLDLTLATNLGDVPITLDRSLAACNVNAVQSLATNGFYDGTQCHRLTNSANLSVLQCGDPTLTGMGGPGWNTPDEDPTGLKEVPIDPQMAAMGMSQQTVIYPRGTIAIANSNNAEQGRANTGSAQFFIVTKDSTLTPTLAVVGHVDDAGMKIIDKVAKGGIVPTATGSAEDGSPKLPLQIKNASVA